jgi:hypothetical protein
MARPCLSEDLVLMSAMARPCLSEDLVLLDHPLACAH